MRIIKVTVDFDVHKVGDHIEVEDQVACDAIAQGYAVPGLLYLEDPEEKAIDASPENRALDAVLEVK